MLTQIRLREMLDYDPETGVFRFRKKRGWEGKPAGCIKPGRGGGYCLIRLAGESFRASRLAWLYMTGEWPDQDVDHIDLDRMNDRWANLRLATRSQNMANGSKRRDNTSGYRGVTWNEATQSWRAQVSVNGKNHYCGLYATREDAAAARDLKATILHGDFVRLSHLN